jgi:hypothetical protein
VVASAEQLAGALLDRAARPDYQRFEAQLRSSGYCARPVRLQGHIEVCEGGGRRRVWSTDREPDGILRKACGNRREAVCPSCAERYRGDAYQLLAAGLRGGKGVPDTIVEHPAVFFTLTAPSFGPCTPGRSARTGSRGAAARDATRPCASTAALCPAPRSTITMSRASGSRCVRSASITGAR